MNTDVINLQSVSIRVGLERFIQLLTMMALLLLPLSSGLVTKCLISASILSLFVGDWQARWKLITAYHFNLIGFALFLLFTAGIYYSQGSWHYVLQDYSRYIKVLYVPILMPFFAARNIRLQAIYAFIIGVSVMVVFGCCRYFEWVPRDFLTSMDRLFVNLIDAAYFAALAGFFSWQLYLEQRKPLFLVVLTGMLGYLFLISNERSGYLVAFALIGICFWQQFRKLGVIIAAVILPTICAACYFFVPRFYEAINYLISELINGPNVGTGSITLRLGFAKYSWQAIKQHLFFGNGTGSFREVYAKTHGPLLHDPLLSHPHNEYLLILFQLGMIGLGLYVLWLLLQWVETKKLKSLECKMSQGLIASFAVLSICNASLYVSAAGTIFVILLAVLFSRQLTSNE